MLKNLSEQRGKVRFFYFFSLSSNRNSLSLLKVLIGELANSRPLFTREAVSLLVELLMELLDSSYLRPLYVVFGEYQFKMKIDRQFVSKNSTNVT